MSALSLLCAAFIFADYIDLTNLSVMQNLMCWAFVIVDSLATPKVRIEKEQLCKS